MNEALLRPLVWMDYRLAFLFTAIAPLILLIWALLRKKEAIYRLLIIYWRVASLLMITLYLLIPGWTVGFISGIASRILIALTLWFWVDLNEEIKDFPQSRLKFAFTSWRWAVTLYCGLGAIASIVSLPCAFSDLAKETTVCQVWLEVPQAYRALFHAQPGNEGFLGFMGAMALTVYILYFVYFLLVRLGKQGRSALEQ
ncbi:conserved membrane hypothetical protein [Hyella patelloides LEGE 07179]|uniref:DUF3177 domain-containing protein n=1 Tax=Hyella patelloides LEGE 07179 TaxID=945734 RepID=A0A563VXN6_9CYAN|nr:DUF3177 family protein [Hyella patelloides]VEP16214.1 conserved membrane hypothetical protein [Hyella patelloides LEGE 07179]